jgi:ABC-type multidrug transport system fused ATPase/permease subunit
VLAIHRALMLLGIVLLALVVAGILRRGKAKQCVLFAAYVTAAGLFTTLGYFFPQHYTRGAYLLKQGIYDSLLFGMSLELSVRTFAAFSGIARFSRTLLALAVGVSTVSIFFATPVNAAYMNVIRFQPGVTTAGIWCLTFVALLIVWYQIPVPAFTRAIILGYVPYLVVFTIYVDLIGRLGWGAIQNLNVLNAVAYDAVAGYWAYAAWRKD